jgi:hypothetical protein
MVEGESLKLLPGTLRWHILAIIYDGQQEKIYMDGKEVYAWAVGRLSVAPSDIKIGRHADFEGGFWNGLIDNVMIWNRALSEDEIEQLYELQDGK